MCCSMTVLANLEIASPAGAVRAHGGKSAFVSKWIVDKATLEVRHGEDLIQNIATYNTGMSAWNAPATGISLTRLTPS